MLTEQHFVPTQVVVTVTKRKKTKVVVKITQAGQARRNRLLPDHCLGCEKEFEEGEQKRCGQCSTCYFRVRNKIDNNKTTLEAEIRDGYMLEPQTGGRPPKNAYTKRLSEM